MKVRPVPVFLSILILIPVLGSGIRAAGPDGRSPAARPAVRGVWAHPGMFGADRDKAVPAIRETLDGYVRAGIDTVIMLVKGTDGYAYFNTRAGVRHPAYDWDFLEVFLKEAAARKITVHPWFCVFHESALPGEVRRHPEWLIRGPRGEMVGVVNPALPEVRRYELELIMEVARNYPVDWVHLDYIRFPCEPDEPYFSFDPATRALFKERSGVDPIDIKARDSGNPVWNEWLEWNRGRVTAFVSELREALKTTGRRIGISAAVFPDAANAAVLIGQDWAAWAGAGLVDMLCPMIYTNDDALFARLTERAVAAGRGHCLVCAGIGLGSSHNRNTPEGMARQMKLARGLGADGVILFSGSSLGPAFLDGLARMDGGTE